MTTSSASAPAVAACSVSSTVSACDWLPVAAITAIRPAAASIATSVNRLRSATVSTLGSPLVPHVTTPWLPSATCQSTSRAYVS